MKNKLKILFAVALCVTLAFSTPLAIYATNVEGVGEGAQGSTGKGASTTIKNAPSSEKTSLIFYLVDKNGKIVSSVMSNKVAPSTGLKSDVLRFGKAKIEEYGKSITNWCNLPPFDKNANGNGGKMKQWLMERTGDTPNAISLVTELWGKQVGNDYAENDYYLIIEPYMWCSLYKGSTYVADVCATTLGWAQLQQRVGENSYTSRYTIGNLPLSMYLDKDLPFMKKAPQTSTNKQLDPMLIQTYGYGCIAVRASEAKGNPLPKEEAKDNPNYLENEKISRPEGLFLLHTIHQ